MLTIEKNGLLLLIFMAVIISIFNLCISIFFSFTTKIVIEFDDQ